VRPEAGVDQNFLNSRIGGVNFEAGYSMRYRGIARPERYHVRRERRIREGAERLHNAHRDWPKGPVSIISF
jgi:hypothetical protein